MPYVCTLRKPRKSDWKRYIFSWYDDMTNDIRYVIGIGIALKKRNETIIGVNE